MHMSRLMQSSPHPIPPSAFTLSHVQTMMSSSSTTLRFRWANRFLSTCRTAGRGPKSPIPFDSRPSRASCIDFAPHPSSACLHGPPSDRAVLASTLAAVGRSTPRTSPTSARCSTSSSGSPCPVGRRSNETSACITIASSRPFCVHQWPVFRRDACLVSATAPCFAPSCARSVLLPSVEPLGSCGRT